MKNSRERGKRGERQWRDALRARGYAARRGQQFSGSPESPDVICEELAWAHFEVKFVEHLNLAAAMAQARRDASGKAAFVAHRKNRRPWLVTMAAERFYRLLRRDLTGEWATRMAAEGTPAAAGAECAWLHCQTVTGRQLNLHEALRTTRLAAENRVAAVAHPDRPGGWLVTVTAADFFRLLRGEAPQGTAGPLRPGADQETISSRPVAGPEQPQN